MSDHPDTDKTIQVRAFAIWTEHVAQLLGCSYADAAVFLMKLGQLVPLMQDADFQGKLARYAHAAAASPLMANASATPQSKGVH